MPLIASQQINSGFGTYHQGDQIDDDVPDTVTDAWQAAGLAEQGDAPAQPKPEPAPRAAKAPKPHRRLVVEKATAPPPERGTSGPQAG